MFMTKEKKDNLSPQASPPSSVEESRKVYSLSEAGDACNEARSLTLPSTETLGWMLPLLPAALIIVGLYFPTFMSLITVWNTDDNYSHGFFIPAFSLIFAKMA